VAGGPSDGSCLSTSGSSLEYRLTLSHRWVLAFRDLGSPGFEPPVFFRRAGRFRGPVRKLISPATPTARAHSVSCVFCLSVTFMRTLPVREACSTISRNSNAVKPSGII